MSCVSCKFRGSRFSYFQDRHDQTGVFEVGPTPILRKQQETVKEPMVDAWSRTFSVGGPTIFTSKTSSCLARTSILIVLRWQKLRDEGETDAQVFRACEQGTVNSDKFAIHRKEIVLIL